MARGEFWGLEFDSLTPSTMMVIKWTSSCNSAYYHADYQVTNSCFTGTAVSPNCAVETFLKSTVTNAKNILILVKHQCRNCVNIEQANPANAM